MIRRRSPLHVALLASVALGTGWYVLQDPAPALGQDMDRSGTVTIENETERALFWSLICTCGCPRETLGTCTCGFAHDRRAELSAMLKKGMTIEQIHDEWLRRYGPQALAVPRNEGPKQLLWLVPALAIVAGAGIAATSLRRWQKRGAGGVATPPGPSPGAAKRDAYDDRLDRELKELDDE